MNFPEITEENLDEIRETIDAIIPADMNNVWVFMSCHREATRLNRINRVYLRALRLVNGFGSLRHQEALNNGLVAMHDHKGWVVCVWTTSEQMALARDAVNYAWELEFEEVARHVVVGLNPRINDVLDSWDDTYSRDDDWVL
jgi:hypothetical protein